jgi:UDP-GlcNAc:undecaprenyl-phosphate GlcNAc-1-phosphate transferase
MFGKIFLWEYQPYLLAFGTAFLVTLFLTPQWIKLAVKHRILDKPGGRKIHQEPVPYCGGLAIYAGFFIGIGAALLAVGGRPGFLPHKAAFSLTGLFLGLTLMLILGILDDRFALPAKIKLLGQILIAFVFIYFGFSIDFITRPFHGLVYLPGWLVIVLSVFWLVGITNAVNLLDGLDGLLAGVSAISATLFFVVALMKGQFLVALLMVALAGCSLAFLRYNFNPAQVFMGDTGSLFIGAAFASISIMGALKLTATVALAVPILIMGIPILDTTFAIVRRFFKGQPIFQADRGHLHHRLLRLGLSQKAAVLLIYAINILLGVLGVVLAFYGK